MQDDASSRDGRCRASSGRPGSPARSCCGCARRTPTSTCAWRPVTPRPGPRSPTCTRASERPTRPGLHALRPRRRRRARPRLPRAAPRRQPGDRAGADRQGRPPRGPGAPTSGSRTRRCTRSGTARRTPHPSCCPTSPTGCRSSTATRSAPPTTSRHPAATRRPRCWRWRRSCAAAWWSPTGSSWTPRRACPAPDDHRSPTPRSAPWTRTSPPTDCSITDTPRRWSRCSARRCCSPRTSRR